jgi:hypothetical protein
MQVIINHFISTSPSKDNNINRPLKRCPNGNVSFHLTPFKVFGFMFNHFIKVVDGVEVSFSQE